MDGDDSVRRCRTCELNVFNLSSLDVEEAAQLIAAASADQYPVLHRRADGTMLTQDCPVGVRSRARRRLLACAVALAGIASPAAFFLSRRQPVTAATLLLQKEFNAATLASTANHYISLGEKAAVAELMELAAPSFNSDLPERIRWLCHVLFRPGPKGPLRPPAFGALMLPQEMYEWPILPVVHSGSSYFVLSEGYMLAGVAEQPREYLEYCTESGNFRTEPIEIPTISKTRRDAATLRQSPAWASIKWKDSGPGFSRGFSEEWVWEFIQRQANSIR